MRTKMSDKKKIKINKPNIEKSWAELEKSKEYFKALDKFIENAMKINPESMRKVINI